MWKTIAIIVMVMLTASAAAQQASHYEQRQAPETCKVTGKNDIARHIQTARCGWKRK